MIIFIRGADSFLARRAVNQLKERYLAKNKGGAELIELDASQTTPNWADLQAIPLFSSSRLIVVSKAGVMPVAEQETLAHYLRALPLTTVAVVWDEKTLNLKSELGTVLEKADKIIDVQPLEESALKKWLSRETAKLNLSLNPEEITGLIKAFGSDLWALTTELNSWALIGRSTSSWAKQESGEKFAFFGAVRSQNWRYLSQLIQEAFDRGEPIELIIGSLAAAVRREVNDKKKQQELVDLFVDIDFGLKVGFLGASEVISLLRAHLVGSITNRVEWEQLYYETHV